MVDFLVTILCSNKIEMLHRCIESVENQKGIDFQYDIFIIVNTLNNDFYLEVLRFFGNKYKVIRTESNGMPGMGHNSCIDTFKKFYKYEQLFILDGDDQLYPYAFKQIEKCIQKENSDVINLTLYDKFQINKFSNNIESNNININLQIKFENSGMNIFKNNYYSSYVNKFNDPLNVGLDRSGTPTRMIYITRNSLETLYTYYPIFDNRMKVYDDIKPFYISLNEYNKNNINITFLNDEHIYLYSSFPISVSHNSQELTIQNKDSEILLLYKNELPIVNNFNKIYDVKFLKLDNREFDNKYKSDFCNKFIDKLLFPDKYIVKEKQKIVFIDLGGNYSIDNITNEGLGGTESAIYNLANSLTNDYNVFIMHRHDINYTNNKGVNIIMFNQNLLSKTHYIITQGNLDLFIHNDFDFPKKYIWIHHDVNVQFIKESYSNKNFDEVKVDGFIFVSNWQKIRYIEKYNIPEKKSYVLQNGISDISERYLYKNIKNMNFNRDNYLCFISKPYRSLIWIKPLFDILKKNIPNIKIKIFSSFGKIINENRIVRLSDLESMENEFDRYYKSLYELLINTDGIEFYGFVNQEFLFQELNKCKILFYPTYFEETCCTSILESMSCGCNIVYTDIGALTETVNNFYKSIKVDINNKVTQYESIDKYIVDPLPINCLDENEIKNIVINTINLLNTYSDKENVYRINKQLKYIKNNCIYKNKKNQFIDIITNV